MQGIKLGQGLGGRSLCVDHFAGRRTTSRARPAAGGGLSAARVSADRVVGFVLQRPAECAAGVERKHPGDEHRELLPESRVQTQARPRQLNGNVANDHMTGPLQGLTAIAAVTLRDGRKGSDFRQLSGRCRHEAIFIAQRSVANDPKPRSSDASQQRRKAKLQGSIAAVF